MSWTTTKATIRVMTSTVFDLDTIGHDPYVLVSILSAFHEGVFTI